MKLMMIAALAVAAATPALAQTAPAADPAMAQTAPSTDQQAATASANASGATPMATPMPADGPYPMCSKTVTDHCMERSNAKGERLHSTPRPKRT